MVRTTSILVALCLVHAVCFAQNWGDHESHDDHDHSWNDHEGHPKPEHHGEHGWMKPHHNDDWSEHIMRMDWGRFFESINLQELLESEDIQKLWADKDWDRLVKRIVVFMHSKNARSKANQEIERHRESRRRCKLAALIAAPIGGVLLLALFAFIIIKCVKKKSRESGQQGRVVYPSAAAANLPYFVGTEEKKLKPEDAFGPAFGPGEDTPPPAYPAETEKPTAPEA